MQMLQVRTESPAETEKLGSAIGTLLKPGFFVALFGELAGGKTCFTRGLVAVVAPHSAEMVASPTYAIMNIYPGLIPVYHFDFYRLSGDDDVMELGFEDYFYGDGITICEWSERLTKLIPEDSLKLLFEYVDESRRLITITSSGSKSDAVLKELSIKLETQKKL